MKRCASIINIMMFSIGILLLANVHAEPLHEPIRILVTDSDLQQFQLMVGERDVNAITDYTGQHSNREAVELVLLHQALYLGGYRGDIELVSENNYSRILRLLEQGKATLAGTTVWSRDLVNRQSFLVSDAVIRRGEFTVGVYVNPENDTALNARELSDYASLSAVSNRNWPVDWRTLEAMNLAHLHHINSMELMVKMIGAGRGDFVLAPFSSRDDLAIHEFGTHQVPVPGVKVLFEDSRHWVASERHPMGATAYNALQAGLAQLRESHRVERAYRQSGFFNEKVADWQIINQANKQLSPPATY